MRISADFPNEVLQYKTNIFFATSSLPEFARFDLLDASWGKVKSWWDRSYRFLVVGFIPNYKLFYQRFSGATGAPLTMYILPHPYFVHGRLRARDKAEFFAKQANTQPDHAGSWYHSHYMPRQQVQGHQVLLTCEEVDF